MDHMTKFIKTTADINDINEDGITFFGKCATICNNEMCLNILSNPFFDVNKIDSSGSTPLLYCILYDMVDVFVEIMGHNDILLNLTDGNGNNAILLSYIFQRLDIFKILIRHLSITKDVAHLYHANNDSNTIIHLMATNNDIIGLSMLGLNKYLSYINCIAHRNNQLKTPYDIVTELFGANSVNFLNIMFEQLIVKAVYDNDTNFFIWLQTIPYNININISSEYRDILSVCCIKKNIRVAGIITDIGKRTSTLSSNMLISALLSCYIDDESQTNRNVFVELIIDTIYSSNKFNDYLSILFLMGFSDPIKTASIFSDLYSRLYFRDIVLLHNEVYDMDACIYEEVPYNNLINFNIPGVGNYTYDVIFLLIHWMYQKECVYFKNSTAEIIYTFPLHKNIFIKQGSIEFMLQNYNITNFNCESEQIDTVFPSSGGINNIYNAQIFKFTI
jgi:hypothetical protein